MSIDPFDVLSDPGIPGYRLASLYEDAYTHTRVLAADSFSREAESRLSDDLMPKTSFEVWLLKMALLALSPFVLGIALGVLLSVMWGLLGMAAGGAAVLVWLSLDRAADTDLRLARAARPAEVAQCQPHLVRLCSTRDPRTVETRNEEHLAVLAYQAAHRYREAKAAVAGDPLLAVHLPDVPSIARDALDAYRDRAWPPVEEINERRQIEGILGGASVWEDDMALRRLRSRQVEFSDQVRERGRAAQSAHTALREADDRVKHLLSRIRAREHLARTSSEGTAGLSS